MTSFLENSLTLSSINFIWKKWHVGYNDPSLFSANIDHRMKWTKMLQTRNFSVSSIVDLYVIAYTHIVKFPCKELWVSLYLTSLNQIKIKLGTDDVAKAIAELPADQKLTSSAPNTKADASPCVESPNKDDSTSEWEIEQGPNTSQKTNKDTKENRVTDHTLSSKGILKVTKYGLRKAPHRTRSYKCQNCGKRERSVRELNIHHRLGHPPLLCGDCNKIFYIPSTFQLHVYEHQKDKNFICETCGQKFSFKGQLDQHMIVHRSIRTHKCMFKDCNRWFMRKADLKVHSATHYMKEYTCEHCASFKTYLKKYWKEHMKGHDDILPYACSICKKRFLYRQQVSRHKAKDHK